MSGDDAVNEDVTGLEPSRDGTDRGADIQASAGVATRFRESLSRTARIARWEVSSSTGTIDRKTVLVLAAMVLVVGVVGFGVADEGLGLEDEIYVVAVDESNPYHDVAVESAQFRPVPLEGGDRDRIGESVDLVVSGDRIWDVGDNGEPAYDAFRDAIDGYNEALMTQEADEAAAYPVLVELDYRERDLATLDDSGSAGSADDDTGDGTISDDGPTSDGARSDTNDEGDASSGDDELQVPNVGGSTGAAETTVGAPGSLSPPFPFRSLVLAFLFVVPMNFVIQAYGSTIMDERIKRRGELLLVSPASRYEIVAGKTLPYLLALVAIAAGIAYAIDGGLLAVAAALPIALLFLASTFVGAMLARSFKELTFVTVAISVGLTTYAFIPAIFTDVTPIALISPLTLIVTALQGESVAAGEYLFSTLPFYLSAVVCFLLGVGIYREEDMFAQKPIPAKVLDAIASQIDALSRWDARLSPFVLSILFIPFIFAGQLLIVALLFAVPEAVALPIVLVLAAAIEELAKSVHVYAGFARSRFEASLRVAVAVGSLSGLGFFVGEKITHIVQFVGLPELTVGTAAFGPDLASTSGPLLAGAIFLAPLALHAATAIVSAIGASRGSVGYALGFVAATLVHAAYNAGVIALVA
ncbi:ABC-type Na+ efflux pump permease component-like protein [Halopiger xanaduensis SH-6]|uniref:ABC-type Na+ efflux pump permease component-like protein n=1 Tax=Halopiger xanaduensis (strain DSM 18323 / JCM 14033 / SH-6) TaxID=797210 RepID=F8D4U4_HALXS|nr:ABC-type Na+ efflux pump permease component-like protein [Halopiger xanaduensis SH-6]